MAGHPHPFNMEVSISRFTYCSISNTKPQLSLIQHRYIAVYAQLNAQFSRTGEGPNAMTEEEFERLKTIVNDLLQFAVDELGKPPNDLLPAG